MVGVITTKKADANNMKFEETLKKIQHWVEEIENVDHTDSFDDIKDVELLESFITQNIFDYCLEQKYELEGFPFVQLEKIDQGERGYDEDFMTYDRLNLYIYLLALEKEDVLELLSLNHYFKGMEKKAIREEIRNIASMMRSDGVSFDLTAEELKYLNRVDEPYRPKLP